MSRLGVLLAVVVSLGPALARADDPPASEEATPEAAPARHWQPQWERVGAAGLTLVVVSEAAAFAVYLAEPVREPRWTDPLPLDLEMRSALRLDELHARQTAVTASDAMLGIMLAWPVLIDAVLLAGVVHGDSDAALQMALIDVETLAVAHLVTWLTTRLAGRVRPEASECVSDGSCGDPGVGPVASFVGGHALMTYASAGLVCTHHLENPWLLGGVEGAAVACGGGLAVATATSFLRIAADRHWGSDVAIGALIGSAIGFGMPFVLHYARPRLAPSSGSGIAILGVSAGAGASIEGLTIVGAF